MGTILLISSRTFEQARMLKLSSKQKLGIEIRRQDLLVKQIEQRLIDGRILEVVGAPISDTECASCRDLRELVAQVFDDMVELGDRSLLDLALYGMGEQGDDVPASYSELGSQLVEMDWSP